MSGTGGSRSDEVGTDSAEGAAGEESPERPGDERPYRFRYGLGHLEPVDFNFHVVSFLVVVCGCGVRRAATPQRCVVRRVVCSACQGVGSTDPTLLPIRKVLLVLAIAPLDNH